MPSNIHFRKIAVRLPSKTPVFRERRDNLAIFVGDARMYELRPRHAFTHPYLLTSEIVQYVIVSKVENELGRETAIFSCDEDALVHDDARSLYKTNTEVTHAEALADFGYVEIDNIYDKENQNV